MTQEEYNSWCAEIDLCADYEMLIDITKYIRTEEHRKCHASAEADRYNDLAVRVNNRRIVVLTAGGII